MFCKERWAGPGSGLLPALEIVRMHNSDEYFLENMFQPHPTPPPQKTTPFICNTVPAGLSAISYSRDFSLGRGGTIKTLHRLLL